ncbi:MAG: ATP-binding cassette domain-containing protein [Anaerolineales bacterium]|nr:ATP-binding cassette domain-containing protein [Anaerolineales bacterium]
MYSVEVSHIAKAFGSNQAVKDVSFQVRPGEIFGLLGPNGAGKTTSIRMLLDIFKPDAGEIAVLGGGITEEKKNRIGYMPEERGMYQDIPLERCLVYFGQLKGLTKSEIDHRLEGWLGMFDLSAHRKKKVKELSKGMQQKAQIIATLLHEPELIIIDEPFTALDPVNTQMIKDLLISQRDKGVTILMSTHQMHQVEELCDRILLVHKGEDLLYGKLADIRKQFASHAVQVRASGQIPELKGITGREPVNGGWMLRLDAEITPQDVLTQLVNAHVIVDQFEIAEPSLDQIFIEVVAEENADAISEAS